MRIGVVDLNRLRGVSQKVFGLGKEVTGVLVGSDRLQQEGEAQQSRASENLKALRAQAEAQRHEVKAEALEQKQKAAQRAKA